MRRASEMDYQVLLWLWMPNFKEKRECRKYDNLHSSLSKAQTALHMYGIVAAKPPFATSFLFTLLYFNHRRNQHSILKFNSGDSFVV